MGSSKWADEHYHDRVATRAASGAATFAHSADIDSGKVAKAVHPSLDPKRLNSLGQKLRDARDTPEHPMSKGVAVLFDVTGSMDEVPKALQKNLPKLMGLLLRKGYLEHPAIMIGAIGDATCDQVPLQIGNFESGIEIENDLTNIYLERGGGGQLTESYELAMYYMAKHTAMDCWEKRGEKGYCFIIGDEQCYPSVNPKQVKELIGDSIEAPINLKEIVAELNKTYEVYYILPHMTSNYQNPIVTRHWENLLPQRTLHLEQPEAICELIASTIGVSEGKVELADVATDLHELGTPKAITDAVGRALAPVRSGGKSFTVKGSGKESGVLSL